MRIVAALATLVKHLLAAGPAGEPARISAAGLPPVGWPSHRHRLLFGRYPAVTLSIRLFTGGLRCRVWKVTIQFT